VGAEADVVVVVDPVVVALLGVALLAPVAVIATLTAIILTLKVVLLHHRLRTVMLLCPLTLGVKQLLALAPIATRVGLVPLLRPKLEHGEATLNQPGVQHQPRMAPQPLLLLSSHSLFLLLAPQLRLPPPLSSLGRKLPGVYSPFP